MFVCVYAWSKLCFVMFRSLCKLVLLAGCLFDSAALRANNLITTVLNPILKEAVEDYADHPLLWVPLSLSAHRSVNAGLTPRAKAPVKAKPRRTRRPAAEAEFPARSSCCSWCFWLLEVAGFVSWFVCVRESEGGCVCVSSASLVVPCLEPRVFPQDGLGCPGFYSD